MRVQGPREVSPAGRGLWGAGRAQVRARGPTTPAQRGRGLWGAHWTLVTAGHTCSVRYTDINTQIETPAATHTNTRPSQAPG